MFKSGFKVPMIPLILITLTFGCRISPEDSDSGYRIIDVTGAVMVLNYSKSTFDFGTISFNEKEEDTLSLAVPEGDLLYILFHDFLFGLAYRYDPADGTILSFEFDTNSQVCYLNDEVVALDLSEGSRAWNWIKLQEQGAFRDIRSLYISLPVTGMKIKSLEKIATSNPDPGLHITGDGPVEELFAIFKPEWIFAEDFSFGSISAGVKSNLIETELLIYSCTDPVGPGIIQDLPGLQSLVLDGCNSEALNGISLEMLPLLRSLCLIRSDLKDLSMIGPPTGIRSLDLVECQNLESIAALRNFTALQSLGFNGCNRIRDPYIIQEIPDLKRLCPPAGISQEEFSAVLACQPSLEVMELLDCENITDLSRLADCPVLKTLVIGTDSMDMEPLSGMQNLELIVIEENYFADTTRIKTLKSALPGTRIVPGGTFCLGSGWILLLMPMILVVVILKKWKKAV